MILLDEQGHIITHTSPSIRAFKSSIFSKETMSNFKDAVSSAEIGHKPPDGGESSFEQKCL
jgi:hypothetical protein